MSQAAIKFGFFVSIFWILISLAQCGSCPLSDVYKLVDEDSCSSHKGNYNGLQNACTSNLDVDAVLGHPLAVPITNSEDMCISSQLVPSPLFVVHSETQGSNTGSLDINGSGSGAASSTQSSRQDGNGSWPMDRLMVHLSDGGVVTCSLDYRELGHGISAPDVNSADQTVLSYCYSHLRYQQASFRFKNIEIEKPQALDLSSLRVNISPSKLDWGQTYLYHPSVASVKIENTCNETALKVYVPFSTDPQFYPFNFSELVLGPGAATSISFVFLPKWLGSSSAELILQTSFGGFLIGAKGFAVDSPYRLRPLDGMYVSSGGWLSRTLSLWNPFNETIHLEEVTSSVSVFLTNSTFLAEAICSKHNPEENSLFNSNKVPTVKSEQSDSVIMAIRPLGNWVVAPHTSENILEMTFWPEPARQVSGAICINLLRPLKGERDTLVFPFEAELNMTAAREEPAGQLSVAMEAVGPCDTNETTISVSILNSALHLLKVVRISEVFDSRKVLQIKCPGELLLFPGTVTTVALVTYESSNVNHDSFIDTGSQSCTLQMLTNDTVNPNLEVSCQEIFGVCSRNQQELTIPEISSVDSNVRRTGYLSSSEQSSVFIKAFGGAEADEYVLKSWRDQRTVNGLHLLDDHELLFPTVPIQGHYAKLITVKNPSRQPVMVQLVLNSGEIVENCKDHHAHLHSPLSSSSNHDDLTVPSRYGFSTLDRTVTEAYLHPYETASLGPILFHPSNRCEWKGLALIRNNLSGVEWLSLRGFGGSVSLALLEDSEFRHRLDFNFNLRSSLNISPPEIVSNTQNATSCCHNSLSKKLVAVNAGDFPIKVKSLHVSGTECKLSGFVVHNCKSFSLDPGESLELGISYQTDFSAPVVQRDLELMLAAGILVIPMKASLPQHMLAFCRKSIFWARVMRCFVFIILAIVILLLIWLLPQMMPSASIDDLSDNEKSSICLARSGDKSSTVYGKQVNVKALTASKHGKVETGIAHSSDSVKEISLPLRPTSLEPEPKPEGRAGEAEANQPVNLSVKTRKERKRRQKKRRGSGLMSLIEVSSSQSGNSTPSSPLSPITSSFSPKDTCSPSPGKRQPSGSSVSFICNSESSHEKGKEAEPNLINASSTDPESQSDNLQFNQLESPDPRKTGNRPMLLPSATFPRTGWPAIPEHSASSRLAISPHARAPGPKIQKAIQAEEQAKPEDRFAYDIWGNHFSGLHLMTGVNDPSSTASKATIEGNSDSFFSKGPQQTLFTNCHSRSVI